MRQQRDGIDDSHLSEGSIVFLVGGGADACWGGMCMIKVGLVAQRVCVYVNISFRMICLPIVVCSDILRGGGGVPQVRRVIG